MCPVCIASTALLIAGSSSAGGVMALVVKKLRAKRAAPIVPAPPQPGCTLHDLKPSSS